MGDGFFMCSWIQFVSILLRFLHLCSLGILVCNSGFFFFVVVVFLGWVFMWFECQGNCDLLIKPGPCSFCFYIVEYWH